MPESVTDRCTKAHEYVFMLTKNARYYYNADAIKEPAIYFDDDRKGRASAEHKSAPDAMKNGIRANKPTGWDTGPGCHDKKIGYYGKGKGNRKTFRGGGVYTNNQSFDNASAAKNDSHGNSPNESGLRNKRSVWTIATKPYDGAHFATFPEKLIEPMILAGSRIGDTVLDPFLGSGTTGQVAQRLGRKWIGIELNEAYAPLQRDRTAQLAMPL